ncbi:MAG: SCO family protein [Bacteroidetes bacterium]|nr:SCO family protein [Bacteroidota bacterium]
MKNSLLILSVFLLAFCSSKQSSIDQDSSIVPESSIYWMNNHWKNQDGKDMRLKDFKGKVVVIAMMFTSCRASCPRLVADVQSIEKGLDKNSLKEVTFVLCTIDPEYDVPQRLKSYAIEHHLPLEHWTLLTADQETTHEMSALLGVKYKRTSPIEFSHSNIISVIDQNGNIFFQQEGIEGDPKLMIDSIKKLL